MYKLIIVVFLHLESQPFPMELTHNYGLTIEFLSQIFQAPDEVQNWSLHGIPAVLFYRKLHTFLKKWNTTRSLQKTAIGRFYLSIDSQLQARNSTPCNTYRFIERIVNSDLPDSTIMSYGILDDEASVLQAEISSCNEHIQVLDQVVVQQQHEIEEMKREIKQTKSQLAKSESTLQQLVVDKTRLERCQNRLVKKVHDADKRFEATLSDLLHLDDLSEEHDPVVCDPEEVLLTKTKLQGNVYRDELRDLYYSLLAEQMPPAKVSHIIKSVLECFVPSLDVECLQLPKERCAGYMRREELRTISMAHKAYVLHESKSLNMNSDGTTKS